MWRGVPFFEQPVELLLGFGKPLGPSFPFDPVALTFEVEKLVDRLGLGELVIPHLRAPA
jgi:hypothetical protein